MRSYAYFWGCYIPGRLPFMEKATRLVFERLGVDVVDLDGLTCCPEKTMIRNASHRAWLLTAARNLALAEEAGRTFVTPCTGCFSTLRGAAVELRSDPALHERVNHELRRIGRHYWGTADAVHLLDVLYHDFGPGALRARLRYPLTGLRIAVHYGCHLLRPSHELMFDDPFWPSKLDQLVEALGAETVDYPLKMECCGNLLLRAGQEETARQMCRAKLAEVAAAGADALVLVCPSCMMQYDSMQSVLQREGENLGVPVFYYPELLALALGVSPDELGLDRHRVEVGPFLQCWQERQQALELVRRHWDYALLSACAACGACADDCPVARADPGFNPNLLVRRLASGAVDAVLESPDLWKCVECYTCAELCPNKYDQMTILRVAKRLALERGQGTPAVADGVRTFLEKGRLTEASQAQRRRLGLPGVPAAPVEELSELLRGAGEEASE